MNQDAVETKMGRASEERSTKDQRSTHAPNGLIYKGIEETGDVAEFNLLVILSNSVVKGKETRAEKFSAQLEKSF